MSLDNDLQGSSLDEILDDVDSMGATKVHRWIAEYKLAGGARG